MKWETKEGTESKTLLHKQWDSDSSLSVRAESDALSCSHAVLTAKLTPWAAATTSFTHRIIE